MSLRVKDYDAIVATMIDHLAANTGVSDNNVGAVARTFVEAVAIVIDELYFQLVDMLNGFYINSAQGSDLDKRLSDYGLQRYLAQPSSLTLSFTGTQSTVIPTGTMVSVEASGSTPALSFVTTADGTAEIGGGANIPAVCTTSGTTGNLPTTGFSTWTIINNPDPQHVTSVTNTSRGYDGFENESDDSFRARGLSFLQSLSKATNSALVGACLNAVNQSTSAPLGITQAFVLENYGLTYHASGGGYTFTQANQDLAGSSSLLPSPYNAYTATLASSQSGKVVIVIDNGQGALSFDNTVPQVTLIINGDPSQPTVYPGYRAAGIQAYITRPAVISPTAITLTVKADKTVLNTNDLITACQNALSLFILQISIGGTLYLSNIIEQCMEISGVLDVNTVSITSPYVVGGNLVAPNLATKITLGSLNDITVNVTY